VVELEERERRVQGVLESKMRQAAEMAAAVQTLGADSRMRIEENVRLRLLAQRLGATPRELESARRAGEHGARAADRIALATAWVPAPSAEAVERDAGGSSEDVVRSMRGLSPGGLRAAEDAAEAFAATTRLAPASPVASRRVPHAAPPPPASFAGASTSPIEALQSQMALREKLKRVRQTFSDIRQDLGYPSDVGRRLDE
jgi:hypothetical protein